MKEIIDNPLKIENKLYTLEEFGSTIRRKVGAADYISNIVLAEIFLTKYPVYSCLIIKSKNHIFNKKCGCC